MTAETRDIVGGAGSRFTPVATFNVNSTDDIRETTDSCSAVAERTIRVSSTVNRTPSFYETEVSR